VEKAHPDLFNVLLQVLDDGRLTDGQGRTVDFRNTILILTSNLGSEALIDPSLTWEEKAAAVASVVERRFRPEFLNRLDDRVLFEPLGPTQLSGIVTIALDALRSRLRERRIELDVTTAARDWLVEHGYHPEYGARPLRRLVQSAIGDPLARELLAGTVRDGDTVEVSVDPADPGRLLVGRRP